MTKKSDNYNTPSLKRTLRGSGVLHIWYRFPLSGIWVSLRGVLHLTLVSRPCHYWGRNPGIGPILIISS
jgi:hypothetical protein